VEREGNKSKMLKPLQEYIEELQELQVNRDNLASLIAD
jgi:hypothetical protein